MKMIPGELFIQDGEIELNVGCKTGDAHGRHYRDRPIQVGSHYHFFETNPALKFDRKKARGMRLDIAAALRCASNPARPATCNSWRWRENASSTVFAWRGKRQAVIHCEAVTVDRFRPPLRGRVGERGVCHTLRST